MCGIFGIYGHPEAAHLVYLGLHGLQHRGQESAGIASSDRSRLYTYRGMGLVVDVFDKPTLARLRGSSGIGHVRYSTAGDSDLANAQPLAVRHARGQLAVAHNGNLVNAGSLRRELEEQGSIFTSNADSEVIVHRFARTNERKIVDRITRTLSGLCGAYSLLFLTERKLIAARDPHGFRPLHLGRVVVADPRRAEEEEEVTVGGGGSAPLGASGPEPLRAAPKTAEEPAVCWVFASETCAFDLIGAELVRPVRPGEIIVVDRKGLRSYQRLGSERKQFCVFEHVYFARPDSMLGGRCVYLSRHAFGRQLARECPAPADLVIPVPDSGTAAALGYAAEAGLPFEMGFIRSHYVGRTFIEPQQSIRHFGVRLKLAPVRALIRGKRVAVVDDSLVRGTTSHKIVTMLRTAGAAQVHLRIASPPVRNPCPYGIDIPTHEELIASQRSEEEIREHVGCDSLGYLSLPGMLEMLQEPGATYCDACFSGNYPVAFEQPGKPRPLLVLQK